MPNLPDDDAINIVFKAIAQSDKLSQHLVLKGGNALKKVYRGPRASVDLDFTEQPPVSKESNDALQKRLDDFCRELDQQLKPLIANSIFEDFGVQSKTIRPPNRQVRTWPAFEIKAGYSKRRDREPPYSDLVKLEITLNDIVCEQQTHEIDGATLNVCSLNDIIAEKLRSLIQQKKTIRNRSRPNDVFDIWFYHQRLESLFDYEKISEFLQRKSDGMVQETLVTTSTFTADPEVKRRARNGFDRINERVSGVPFPSFNEAWQGVLAVANQLDIPD